eukprot:6188459-Pleurochrysis_carterae.AAC.1
MDSSSKNAGWTAGRFHKNLRQREDVQKFPNSTSQYVCPFLAYLPHGEASRALCVFCRREEKELRQVDDPQPHDAE